MQSRVISSLAAIIFLATPLLVVDVRGGQQPIEVDPPAPAVQPEAPEGLEPLVRGPIHEAYAQPTDLRPAPGDPVPKAPPEPVPEIPPDMRPEGDNVVWVAGYWAWEPEEKEFIWVSGVYRHVPEGRQWVPGHWIESPEGWRWVSGFWAAAGAGEIAYSPEPPETLERGPALPPPDADSFYVPGTWIYRETRYVWQPGYYAPCRPGLIWIPARYVWCPTGYVFVNGYWDYPWERRGLLFAPVVFHRPLWRDPFWRYCPTYVVRSNFFFDACFYNRGFNHFYFGNYFTARRGFHPWWGGPSRFDPHFQYYRWQNRNRPNWVNNMQSAYAERAAGRRAAPPRTFQQQQRLVAGTGNGAGIPRNLSQVVAPLGKADLKLTRLAPAQLEKQKAFGERARELSAARSKFERPGVVAPKAGKAAVQSFKLPAAKARLTGERPAFSRKIKDTNGVLTMPRNGSSDGSGKGGFPRRDGPIVGKPPAPTPSGPSASGAKTGAPPIIDPSRRSGSPRNIGAPRGPGKDGIGVPKAPARPSASPVSPPRATTPRAFPSTPQVTPAAPRITSPAPSAPRVTTPPTPRITSPSPSAPRATPATPRIIRPSAPRFSPPAAPRITSPSPSAPRATPAAPRIISPAPSAPRFSPPAAPRITSPPRSAPRMTAPAGPRFSPPSAPRMTRPAPAAPRISSPPSAPRFSAPSRPGGGRGIGGPPGGGIGRGRGKR